MIRGGITGEVIVRVHVGADGLVRQAAVLKTTQQEFGPPAVSAVERWRFVEYLDAGVTRRRGMVVDCRIIFALDESWPNKAPEPMPGPVTVRAGARSAPGPGMAHL
jgi:TonB family protein